MKVTIDEARVGKQPILKIDGIELANIVNGYTLHHDAGQPATLELRIAFGADLSEIEALIENPNVKIIMPEEELRRIFSIVDEPQCDDMVVWFYSSLEDIGRKPFDVALLERSGKDAWSTIRRPT